MSEPLRDLRVLITGAGRGIGLALARRFASAGCSLVLTDIDDDALAAAAAAVAPTPCLTAHLDVTDRNAILAFRERLHAELGIIQVLVNNAGVVYGGPFLDVPLERHVATFRVNVEGVCAMTHAFLPDLIASWRGYLVNMASASGFIGLPHGASYASSKWAVIGLSESIRLELKRLGHRRVSVTTVCPSYVDTGLFAGATAPRTTHMLAPDELAEKIFHAVARRQPFVLEPWLVKVTPLLKSALPTGLGDAVAELFGANASMESWEGRR